MLNAFDRFLISRGLILCLGATGVLTITMVFQQSQRLVDAVTNFGMPLTTFGQLLISLAPWMADGAMLAGVAVGLTFTMLAGRGSKELLISQALGQSPFRRFLPFLVLALILAVSQLLLSMLIAPPTLRLHQDTRKNYQREVNFEDSLNPGVFIRVTPQSILYLTEKIDGQNFRGIRMSDRSIEGLTTSTYANRGSIYVDDQGLSLVLFEGMQIVEGTPSGVPRVMTFSALPIAFDRTSGGFAEGRISATSERRDATSSLGQTRGSAPAISTPQSSEATQNPASSQRLDISKLTPSEVPISMAWNGAIFVIENFSSNGNFRVQPIRVPSNEFHRRLSTALAIPMIVWLIFCFLATDFHLRRPPIFGYCVIGLVVTIVLLVPRFVMETDARNFPIMYLGTLVPVPVALAKIYFGRRA